MAPKIPRMRIRLVVVRRILHAGRWLEEGDVLDLDLSDSTCVLGARVPWNAGALLGMVSEGTLDPIEVTPSAVALALAPTSRPPRPPRVLAFRRRRPA